MFVNLEVQRKYIGPLKQRQEDKVEYCNRRRTSDVEAGARLISTDCLDLENGFKTIKLEIINLNEWHNLYGK